MKLKDKVAIVTGGASGLGRAVVDLFVERGAQVAVFDLNDEAGAEVEKAHAGKVRYFHTNVADEQGAASSVSGAVEAFGALHVCVNCAGIATGGKILGRDGPLPLPDFQKTINVNLIGTFNVARLAAEQMAKNEPMGEAGERGAIVNTASVAAFEGQIGQAAYGASKAGVAGMTLPIARDLASIGVRCNTIAPGFFHTPMMDAMPQNVYDSLVAMVQFPKRLGAPAEYAALAAHLVENAYINGEVIRLDAAARMQPR